MTLNLLGPKKTIKIPTDVVLDSILKKLERPCPEYKNKDIGGSFFQTEVLFYLSAHFLKISLPPHSGSPALSLEAQKNCAASDAIQYMATDHRKILKDYNYDELKKQRKNNKCLWRELGR